MALRLPTNKTKVMKGKFVLIVSLLGLLFTSCAYHSGIMTGNASLSGTDFEIIAIVSGSAKTTHVFSIGGLKSQALVYDAKKNLYRSHPLKKGQAFANVSVDFKRSYFPFVGTTIATITADVVQYGNRRDSTLQSGVEPFKSKQVMAITKQVFSDSSRTWTDTIMYVPVSRINPYTANKVVAIFDNQKLIKVRILDGIEINDRYEVEFLYAQDGSRKSIKAKKLFLFEVDDNMPNHNFKVGDPVHFSIGKAELNLGVIAAIGKEKVILKSGKSIYEVKVKGLKPYKP